MNLKENRIFIFAFVISVLIHLYIIKTDSPFPEYGGNNIKIPVSFIPEAEINTPLKSAKEEKQITIPDDKPLKEGYYKTYNRNRIIKSYLEMIKKEIIKRKFSPSESRYYGLIGNATIGFTVTGNGHFAAITILRSSGDPLLDRTAMNAVSETSYKIKRPAAAGRNNIRVNITVKYQYGL